MLYYCVLPFSSAEQVGAVFGPNILAYTVSLCEGKFDYLERLPDDILLRILSFLELKDIPLMAQVSRRFRMVSLSKCCVTFCFAPLLIGMFMLKCIISQNVTCPVNL